MLSANLEKLNQEPQRSRLRDETTIVIRDVPAQICTTCGEEYVDAVTGKRLSQIAEMAVNEGVQVDVRRYKAA